MANIKEERNDATASPGRKELGSINKVVFNCEDCNLFFVEDRRDSKCPDCDKEMKQIGNVEYREEV